MNDDADGPQDAGPPPGVPDPAALARITVATAAGDDAAFGAAARRVRHRVLARVAEDQRARHLTVQASDGTWQPLGPGLTMKVLHARDGVMSYLLRLAPGASLPAHRHPIDEECVVLEGMLQLGDLEVHAGAYHLGQQGVPHMRIDSPGGALIFLRGAPPSVEHLV